MGEKIKRALGKFTFVAIFVICLLVFLYSFANFLQISIQYSESEAFYDQASAEFTEAQSSGPPIKVKMKKLRKINRDIKGWIYMEGTTVDYPILQGENNKYYLDKTFYGKYMPSGSIFLDYKNAPDFTDNHTIVYGHNMKNHAMFGDLNYFTKENYLEEHPYVWVLLPGGAWMKYEIYSVYQANIKDGTYRLPLNNMQDFEKFIKLTEKKNIFQDKEELPKPQAEFSTKVLTLSTCTEDSADQKRFVVHAVLIAQKDKNGTITRTAAGRDQDLSGE